MSRPRWGAWLLGLYAFVAAYLVPVFPHGGSANELTRWATAASLVERGTFELSWTEPLVGPIVDTAKRDDRVYSNKAPAPALLGLPAYWAARRVMGPPDAANIRVSWTLMRWLVATLPLLLLALWLWRAGAEPLMLATLLFATPLFLYSLLLFSHALAAVAVSAAYRALFGGETASPPARSLLAGAFSGLAVASEFPAAVPVAVFAVSLLCRAAIPWRARLTSLGAFAAGGLPFAVGLALYNDRVFGSPLSFSYEHEAFAEWAAVAEGGLFGVGWPSARGLWTLLLSPSRGLFFYAPILALGAAGLVRARGADAFRARVAAAAALATALVLSGHGAPHGGWAAGPRYLVLVIPLLVEGLRTPGRVPPAWTGLAFGVSLLLSVLPALTFPFAPPELRFPHNELWRPLLLAERWTTPTLGALAGLGAGFTAALPAWLALAAVPAVVWAASSHRRAFGTGLAGAVAAVAGYALWPGLETDAGRLRRATIAERFFRPGDRLAAPLREANAAADVARLRMLDGMQWMIAETRGHAPSDWPYAPAAPLIAGPGAREKRAQDLARKGDLAGAETVLRQARDDLPFARCAITANLGVVLYHAGRKPEALHELESARPLARRGASPGCARALLLLGTLYGEGGRTDDAVAALREFLEATSGLGDRETLAAREAVARMIASAVGSR